MKNFKPQLVSNKEVDLDTIKYPMLASYKLDGIRAIFKDGQLLSRSLKVLPNINLHKKFQNLKDYSKNNNVILDGELYCLSVPFNDLSGIIRSDNQELPIDLEFWCFDYLTDENKPFVNRMADYSELKEANLIGVKQVVVNNSAEVIKYYEQARAKKYEGLILRNPDSRYKFGRCTHKSNDGYKVKPYCTYEAKIIRIEQATQVIEGAEKKVNELGRSVTSQKKADRVLIPRAATFIVMYKGNELGVSIAMTNEEKDEIWQNQDKYVGRWIEYRCMEVGMKTGGVPRHATSIRFRDDKQ